MDVGERLRSHPPIVREVFRIDADRVAALGGRLRVDSPRGGGTVVAAELPLHAPD